MTTFTTITAMTTTTTAVNETEETETALVLAEMRSGEAEAGPGGWVLGEHTLVVALASAFMFLLLVSVVLTALYFRWVGIMFRYS